MASFVENLDAFTRAFGVENAPAVITFSLHPWESTEQRDAFIKDTTGIDFAAVNAYGS